MAIRRTVLVPPERLARWLENFGARHGGPAQLTVAGGAVLARAPDGSRARLCPPFGRRVRDVVGDPVAGLLAEASRELPWGVLLVRKGGFALAAGTAPRPTLTKVGSRHVQGRTKAGGQSQQRFARRREQQARQAYDAAATHAHRLLVQQFGGVEALVCGGDRAAVDAVLAHPRLSHLAAVRAGPWLDVPDPRRDVLDRAVVSAHACVVEVQDAMPTEEERP